MDLRRLPVSPPGRRGTGRESENVGLARVQHGPDPQLFLKSQHALCSGTGHSCLALVRAASGLGGKAERNRPTHRAPSRGGASVQTRLRMPALQRSGKAQDASISAAHTPRNPTTRSLSPLRSLEHKGRVELIKHRRPSLTGLWLKSANGRVKLRTRQERPSRTPIPATRASPSCSILRCLWLARTVTEGTTCEGRC